MLGFDKAAEEVWCLTGHHMITLVQLMASLCITLVLPQLMWDVFAARFGTGHGAIPLMYIPCVALYFGVYCIYLSSIR